MIFLAVKLLVGVFIMLINVKMPRIVGSAELSMKKVYNLGASRNITKTDHRLAYECYKMNKIIILDCQEIFLTRETSSSISFCSKLMLKHVSLKMIIHSAKI